MIEKYLKAEAIRHPDQMFKPVSRLLEGQLIKFLLTSMTKFITHRFRLKRYKEDLRSHFSVRNHLLSSHDDAGGIIFEGHFVQFFVCWLRMIKIRSSRENTSHCR